MSNNKDFYEVLELPKTASADEIKKAYRKLAHKYHPDKNLGDPTTEEQFKEVKRAYEILSDVTKRAAYDQFGHGGVDNNARQQHDAYNEAFKRAFNEQHHRTMQLQVGITLEQAIRGGNITVDVPTTEACPACDGTGSKTKSRTTCVQCNGSGQSIGHIGGMTFARACERCGGAGEIVIDRCNTCNGSGQVRNLHKQELNIPPGVNTGEAIRQGFKDHEVIFVFVIHQHPVFMRDGNNLIRTVEVDVVTATIGGKLIVEDVFGTALAITVPPGTQPMQSLRLVGKGVLRNGRAGDMYCQIIVKVPTSLSEKQRELYEQLREVQVVNKEL